MAAGNMLMVPTDLDAAAKQQSVIDRQARIKLVHLCTDGNIEAEQHVRHGTLLSRISLSLPFAEAHPRPAGTSGQMPTPVEVAAGHMIPESPWKSSGK